FPPLLFFSLLMLRRPPRSTLFPYTTLFRSPYSDGAAKAWSVCGRLRSSMSVLIIVFASLIEARLGSIIRATGQARKSPMHTYLTVERPDDLPDCRHARLGSRASIRLFRERRSHHGRFYALLHCPADRLCGQPVLSGTEGLAAARD